ncbi:hypothetical protein FEM48_Zijuj07G0024900 [Ziziphus jujuba var. spinosa]|uniref:Cucumisin-like n=1 Tax=Ziziphus jujuba var. spinosa TaxID=714518 RepID=A0A978V1X8_ZIZJJ|nr:hypothetical protein FEM48_Zijuj07G0024900 [Ziziphus jujuba var. spinosa]
MCFSSPCNRQAAIHFALAMLSFAIYAYIVYMGDIPKEEVSTSSVHINMLQNVIGRYCFPNSLNKNLVKGKIVICDVLTNGRGPFLAGAAGLVMKGQVVGDVVGSLPLPASFLSVDDGSKINTYMNSTRNATASIFRSNEVTDKLAPYIPSFSSRGPNPISRNILKPDLAAPGVYILAAWSPIAPISGVEGDDRVVNYNIISGTSMACPHASATAAYIKSFHPTWSPAAIKSSLITTANPMRSDLNPESEFAYGSGNISIECPKGNNETIIIDLNYPSFALSTPASESFNRVFHRTVTNVGSQTSTYKANLIGPLGINITVEPSVLSFTSLGQKLSFTLKIEGKLDGFLESASLLWDDGTFQVKSPIVIYVAL